MKRILSIAVASLAVAAVADSFSPQIGVTTLDLNQKNNIIPVQFTSLAGTGEVTADALVCTNNIPVGSHLYVYQNGYSAWTLANNGWVAYDSVTEADGISAGVPAVDQSLPVGTGIWLSFASAPVSAVTVSFYGKVASNTNSVIAAGASDNPVSTLVCNPTSSGVSLAGKFGTGKVVPAKGDKITLLGESTYSGYYSYNGSDWKYVAADNTITVQTPTIPAYGGFWYLSKGGSGTINWVE